jgi:flagellar hook protein FlgE
MRRRRSLRSTKLLSRQLHSARASPLWPEGTNRRGPGRNQKRNQGRNQVSSQERNGSQLFTQDGNFQLSANGTLQTAEGLSVMGYPAKAGVVNTSGGLTDINIPTGQVMSPSATTSLSATQNLDSQSAVGTTASSQVQIYDSLGATYEATVTYTNLGNNSWGYSISVPNTLTGTTPAATTITSPVAQSSSTAAGTTTLTYDFGTNAGKLATVDPSTRLVITGPKGAGTASITAPAVTANETVAQYAAALNTALISAGITTGAGGVQVSATAGGQLTITGPSATLSTTGAVDQAMAGSATSYSFGSSNGTMTSVDPGTNLTITGPTSNGSTATIAAPAVTAGESVKSYVASLNTALTAAGITGVTVSGPSASGQVTINSLGVAGSVIQDPVASASSTGTLSFDANGNLITPATNITGITFSGLSDDANPLNMTWNLFGPTGNSLVSQNAAASGTSGTNQNGYAAGQYESFAIDGTGTIAATYSNGQTQKVGQLALGTVSNEQGLTALGSTEYESTFASGTAAVGTAGTGGRGTIDGSSLEASNVDISEEFSQLIVAQRAFEANSKSVTTFDSVTQETINMIH